MQRGAFAAARKKRIERREQLLAENQRQYEEKQTKINHLFEAIAGGYLEATRRLLTEENINQVSEEYGNKTPLEFVIDCIFKSKDRSNIVSYYYILDFLLKRQADKSRISNKDWFVIYHLCPLIMLKGGDLYVPRGNPSIQANQAQSNQPKSAADVFNGEDFDIRKLRKIKKEKLDDYLYGNQDFTVELSDGFWGGRKEIGVKLGKLYIQYQPGGKGSFIAKVFLIDREKKELNLLHQFDEDRYVGLEFDAMIPFHLSTFYGAMTCCAPSSSFDFQTAIQFYRESYQIKNDIIQLALSRDSGIFYVIVPSSEQLAPQLTSGMICRNNAELNTFLAENPDSFNIFKITDSTFVLPRELKILDEAHMLDLTTFQSVEATWIDMAKQKEQVDADHLQFKNCPFAQEGQSYIGSQIRSFAASAIQYSEIRKKNEADLNRMPDVFLCPISSDVMKKPVTTCYGHTYDEAAILSWINLRLTQGLPVTNPVSGQVIPAPYVLVPNRALQDAIVAWEELRKEKRKKHNETLLNRVLAKHGEKVQKEEMQTSDEEVPDAYCCNICFELMENPVMSLQGLSYEESEILAWLEKNASDPANRQPLTAKDLITNYTLRDAIEDWKMRKAKIEQIKAERAKQQEESNKIDKEKGKEKMREDISAESDKKEKVKENISEPKSKEKEKEREYEHERLSDIDPMVSFINFKRSSHSEVKQGPNPYTFETLYKEYANVIGILKVDDLQEIIKAYEEKNQDDVIKLLRELSTHAMKNGSFKIKVAGLGMTIFSASYPTKKPDLFHLLADLQTDLNSNQGIYYIPSHLFKLFDFILAQPLELETQQALKEHYLTVYPDYQIHLEEKKLGYEI